jgi:hypothetical protein
MRTSETTIGTRVVVSGPGYHSIRNKRGTVTSIHTEPAVPYVVVMLDNGEEHDVYALSLRPEVKA